ncbi:thioredoxin-related transmembrane protein 1 isoform X2 [Chrysoperla carnea]|uniref:thioredoxin-related transmembrane protein 1 isoform X2 n=1 Tax=Chrysoperla carnea TaxID=189513 RepID=UPI001D062E3F|nr:thioredoxin-related transmembrane protein 1 isoform X2 [Chrysoperla carnea]
MDCKILLLFSILLSVFGCLRAKPSVINLDEDNWKRMLEDEWMVEFFAPWCPACKSLTSDWNAFADWSRELGIKVGQVDVTTSPGLSGRFMVTALPTIFHVINGEFRQYRGTRDKNAFMTFIEEKKWQSIEPIPGWKSPQSFQMSVVSSFFKLSQILRSVHNHFMTEYGLPSWGSYLIFALATIILGAILGLILVCIIDFVYPPKPIYKEKIETINAKGDSKPIVEELADEDIKDDLLDDGSNNENEIRKRKARRAD